MSKDDEWRWRVDARAMVRRTVDIAKIGFDAERKSWHLAVRRASVWAMSVSMAVEVSVGDSRERGR